MKQTVEIEGVVFSYNSFKPLHCRNGRKGTPNGKLRIGFYFAKIENTAVLRII